MPSYLALLTLPLVAFTAYRLFNLTRNYLEARKLGIPIILLPVSNQDGIWILLLPHLRFLRRLPLVGYIFDFSYYSWAQDLRYLPHRKYGDVFAQVSPSKTLISINDPAVAIEVQTHYKTWIKPPRIYEAFNGFGPNVLASNGDDWQRHRRIVNPAFREQNNKLVWEESLKQARQMLQVAKGRPRSSGTLLQVRSDCVLIAMHVLSAAGFGHAHDFDGGFRDVPSGHTTSLAEALKFLLDNLLPGLLLKRIPLLHLFMPSLHLRIKAMSKEFHQYMHEIVSYNRATTRGGAKPSTSDIVSALVEADEAAKRDEIVAAKTTAKPLHLSDAELKGDLFIFNLAGFETTANALTYTFPYLACKPDVQAWVGEEIDAVLKGRAMDELEYDEVYPSLVRCMALMYETMRLWAPIPCVSRWCVGEPQTLRVNGRDIIVPPETYVALNMYGVHSDPRWWGEDGLEWRPQRWIDVDPKTGKESLARPPAGATFSPWSTGPRVCPGKKFSQVEFVAVISTLLASFRVKPLVIEGKMKDEEQAKAALMQVVYDSKNVITPKMRRPEDAGVVLVAR